MESIGRRKLVGVGGDRELDWKVGRRLGLRVD
jgi:hypothetical protein